MKKTISILLAVAMILLSFAACGKTETTDQTATQQIDAQTNASEDRPAPPDGAPSGDPPGEPPEGAPNGTPPEGGPGGNLPSGGPGSSSADVTYDGTTELTGDTYLTSFSGNAANVISNGYTLYVNATALTGTK